MSQPAIKLYGFPLSGHSHRVELMLSLLGLPSEFILVDLKQGAHKSAAFLANINSFGQVPAIDDGGVVLADSNAILVYLASRYGNGQWLPSDPVGQARVQRWLSAAAGPLHAGPATARLAVVFGADVDAPLAISRAHGLLSLLEQQLSQTPFLVGEQPSIADVAFYSYVAHAPEGNVSLADYPQVRAWLGRIEALPGFVGMPRTAVGLQSS
ncbi:MULTISPECIES: glutathione S-transferase family protein [Pseudomonas]|jgi:glutathione S-transferase|uniref:Glutathione S-transferase family protein n=1 Tax=Pseudomonas rhodesiae TaxID=76760 RepID=A0A8I1E545_9PSED|nr:MULTISPECIES: glutathione S-transferase [Pseudomonas]OXS19187.1 glutathione S-transferase [Pseudomonas fluorescens]MBI6605820.1 glutathione S-transferase family protein [Pseudomonas sp. S4_EA_1b]MBI6625227.1 glutathione S-transferase family protein [Pseudomonas rhodesiae]MDN6865585.1 glutathione S-transferase [Pseudomonas rhodesiae]NMY80608.1 glutathione S-transferase family protein [Pseudomonas rhodesiae]